MSDVRLVGTSPEDGSLVPVAVTPAGLLKTAIGKIEKIPNDVEIDGDLTVTGTINGEQGGGGSLPSGGVDGDVLQIVDGAPAWVQGSTLCPEPEPEPEPPAAVVKIVPSSIAITGNSPVDRDGNIVSGVADLDAWLRTQDCWTDPFKNWVNGVGGLDVGNTTVNVRLDLSGALGKILNVAACFEGSYEGHGGGAEWTARLETTNSNIQTIRNSYSWQQSLAGTGTARKNYEFSFLVNRDAVTADFEFGMSGAFFNTNYRHFSLIRYYELIDPAIYWARRAVELQQQLLELAEQNSATDS